MKSPCCNPSPEHQPVFASPASSPPPPTIAPPAGEPSYRGMVRLGGGTFLMGGEGEGVWFADGESPVRETELSAFWIDETTVTNAAFASFVDAVGHATEAERFSWSFVHLSQLSEEQRERHASRRVGNLEWWFGIEGANWRTPLGDGRCFDELGRRDHPVVHVSWNDAAAFAHWAGKRLPTEAEWEFAARGGLLQRRYPWGDELLVGGEHRCNLWQGTFPTLDTGEDGYCGTAPARSFPPNGHGLYHMAGNVWEWAADWFSPVYGRTAPRENPKGPEQGERRAMRGGSYLCHESYCNRYRCSARSSNTPDTSTGHLGFRCAADG